MTDLYKTLRSLRNHERGIRPDPAWVRATRERLLMQVRNTMPSAAAAEKNRKTLAAAYPSVMRVLRGPVFVICAVIALITGGSIASVRAAEQSLPGDVLYTVKLVAEQTRLALTPSTVERVKLKAEFTKRRVLDLQTVITSPVAQKETRVKQAADILKQDIRTLQEQLNKVHEDVSDSRVAAEAAKVVDREAVGVVRSLQETKAGLADTVMSPETQKVVADTQAQAADLAMNALGMLIDARKDDAAKDVMSDEDLSASVVEHRDVAVVSAASALQRAEGVAEPTNVVATTSTAANGSSLAVPAVAVSVTGTAALAKDAQNALGEIEALLQAAKVDEAVTKLREGSEKSFQAQSQIETLLFASGMSASSSPSIVSSGTSTDAGVGGTTTSSNQSSP